MSFIVNIFKNFSKKERLLFIVSSAIFVISSVFWTAGFFYKKTVSAAVSGGDYIEGVVGQPSFINPILSSANTPDSDIEELLFVKLSDLSDSIKISDNGRVWDVRLKENVFWDDKEMLTSQDVDFTIKKIQSADVQSPLKPMWQGAQTEVISKLEIKVILPQQYSFFDDTLKNLKVVPEHLFSDVPAANLKISDYNLEPVGNGPFKFSSFKKEKSGFISEYKLVRNGAYFGQRPYLESITFKFYKNEDELIRAFNSGEVSGFGGIYAKNLDKILIGDKVFDLVMPRYYALFFNSYSQKTLTDKNVRLALNYAIGKEDIVKKVFNGKAFVADGPLAPGMSGYSADANSIHEFSLEKAASVLDAAGWKTGEDGIRYKTAGKETTRLEFNLISPQAQFLEETANIIAGDWLKIGVKLNVSFKTSEDMGVAIQTRNYEMVLFGNSFSGYNNSDMSSFWHSSQKFYPGMNLSLYENKNADDLIEIARQTLSESRRLSSLSSLQSIITGDMPAIFLFSPNYLYIGKPYLGGFEDGMIDSASDRFANIENWYIKTARIFK